MEVEAQGDSTMVFFDGKLFPVELTGERDGGALLAKVGQDGMRVVLEDETEATLKLVIDGRTIVLGRAQVKLETGQPANGRQPEAIDESNALLSPMFGKVISVEVRAGDSVGSGQPLIIMEAMKMESVLRSDGEHRVKEILVKEGDGVDKGQVLIRFG